MSEEKQQTEETENSETENSEIENSQIENSQIEESQNPETPQHQKPDDYQQPDDHQRASENQANDLPEDSPSSDDLPISEEDNESGTDTETDTDTETETVEVSDKPYYLNDDYDDDYDGLVDDTSSNKMRFVLLTLFAIGIISAIRAWLGDIIGTGDAEAYYFAFSKNLDLSYYDHPPAIAYLIKLGTYWLGDTTLALRISSVIFSGLTAGILYLLTVKLFDNHKAGFLACLIFLLSPVFFIGGTAAAPDTSLGFFWLLSAYVLFLAVDKNQPKLLLLLGLLVGFGLLSKYFMILFWPVTILYLLFGRGSKLLLSPFFPAAILISAIVFSPVLYWNFLNDWASFNYHLFTRHADTSLDAYRFFKFLGGQVLYLSPFLFVLLVLTVIKSISYMIHKTGRDAVLLFWISVPVLVFFYLVGAWTNQSEPHWPLIGYLLLIPVLANWLANLSDFVPDTLERFTFIGPMAFFTKPKRRTMILGWLFVPSIFINSLLMLHLSTDYGFYVISLLPDSYYQARYDLSNELYGWDQVADKINEELPALGEQAFVASYHYTMCGQLAFATKTTDNIACLSKRYDAFDFFENKINPIGKNGLIITDNRYNRDPNEMFDCKGGLNEISSTEIKRADKIVRTFKLFSCTDYQGFLDPSKILPKEIEQEKEPETSTPTKETPLANADKPNVKQEDTNEPIQTKETEPVGTEAKVEPSPEPILTSPVETEPVETAPVKPVASPEEKTILPRIMEL